MSSTAHATAQDLISRSISHDEIARAAHTEELHEVLVGLCSDWTDVGSSNDYWADGEAEKPGDMKWRIILDGAPTEEHLCAPGEWRREYDAQGIYLCRVCDVCRAEKLSGYRPEILTGYTQADVDEPIGPD